MLLGRVGQNPEIRATKTGNKMVYFSLATTETWAKDNGEEGSKTEWHKITCFRPGLCDTVMENVTKGQRLFVQGRIQYGQYTDAEENVRKTTDIIADDIIRFAAVPNEQFQ